MTSIVGAADVEALGGRGIEAANVNGVVTTASLERLSRMLEAGDIVPPEIRAFQLADAGAAAAVGSGHVRGKVVVALD